MPSYSDNLPERNKNLAPIPDTSYVLPRQTFTSPFSSVNVGVSEEGGLSTLTYKSIGYTQYAEQVELMRDALYYKPHDELTRLREKDYDAKDQLERLKTELEALKSTGKQDTSSHITAVNEKLTQLISNGNLKDIEKEVLENYKPTGKDFLIDPPAYKQVSVRIPAQVSSMLEVSNLDTSVYDSRKAVTRQVQEIVPMSIDVPEQGLGPDQGLDVPDVSAFVGSQFNDGQFPDPYQVLMHPDNDDVNMN